MREGCTLVLSRCLSVPFLAVMVAVSVWDQRLFFAILGTWSLYLLAYPLYRGRLSRGSLLTLSTIVLSFPFMVYAADLLVQPSWGPLMRVSELMSVYSVGLFTFLHLVTYHGMRLERLSLTLFCTVSTISMGMVFVLGQYLNNLIFGTEFIESNAILMQDLALTLMGSLTISSMLFIYLWHKGIKTIRPLESEHQQEGGP
jgi:hypothetical protein